MSLEFLARPGMRERHLKRQYNNLLFDASLREFDEQRLNGARFMDEKEAEEFLPAFHQLVEEIAQLKPNEDSEKLLELKARLDHSYEVCSGLAGDLVEIKQAIIRLVEVIMASIWQGAKGDAEAEQNLYEEELARKTHYQLLQYPIVADLLKPRSPIAPEQLVATLLSESEPGLEAALHLFDKEQLQEIVAQAQTLLASLPEGEALAQAKERLKQIEQKISQLSLES